MESIQAPAQQEYQPPRPSAAWTEIIPLETRKRKAILVGVAALAAALWIWYLQFQNGALLSSFWAGFFPLAVGAWIARSIIKDDHVWVYRTETVVFTKQQRLAAASKWWIFGGVLALVLALCGLFEFSFFAGALFSLLFFGVLGSVVYLRRELSFRTKEAEEIYVFHQKREAASSSGFESEFWALVAKPIVRYPIAAALVWAAFALWDNPKVKGIHIGILICVALWAAREIVLWLLGIALVVGLASLMFQGLAALPLGVAVIIGALIIASAIKK